MQNIYLQRVSNGINLVIIKNRWQWSNYLTDWHLVNLCDARRMHTFAAHGSNAGLK